MAESDAHALRGYSGATVETELSAGISAAATTISCSDLSSWTAADDVGPGRATITDGTSEEEVEFTAVSANSLTGCTRGVGGTTARAWDAGTTISHKASVRDFIEANRVVNRVLGVASVAAGDLYYVSSVSNGPVFSRLPKGTARQLLRMNAAATAPEWGGFAPVFAYKSVNEDLPSSTTLQADNDLVFAAGTNQIWAVRYVLLVAAGAEAADIALSITVPSGAARFAAFGLPVAATDPSASTAANVVFNHGDTAQFGIDAVFATSITIDGLISTGGSAGNVTLSWAQIASNVTATSVLAYSHLRAERVS